MTTQRDKKELAIPRNLFFQNLVAQQAALGNETISNDILRINMNEELCESYRRIKFVTKTFHGATETILIAIPDSQMEMITTHKIKIEHVLSHQNEKIPSAFFLRFNKTN